MNDGISGEPTFHKQVTPTVAADARREGNAVSNPKIQGPPRSNPAGSQLIGNQRGTSVKAAIQETTEEPATEAAVGSEVGLAPKWGERLHALRHHTPLLFRMVWESAPGVVVGSLGARLIASLLPLAMLAVTGTIIESIHRYTSHLGALPHYFWWLVAA